MNKYNCWKNWLYFGVMVLGRAFNKLLPSFNFLTLCKVLHLKPNCCPFFSPLLPPSSFSPPLSPAKSWIRKWPYSFQSRQDLTRQQQAKDNKRNGGEISKNVRKWKTDDLTSLVASSEHWLQFASKLNLELPAKVEEITKDQSEHLRRRRALIELWRSPFTSHDWLFQPQSVRVGQLRWFSDKYSHITNLLTFFCMLLGINLRIVSYTRKQQILN